MTRSTGISGFARLWIATHPRQRVPHRRQIHHAGHSGEILQQDSRGHELHFLLSSISVPLRDVLDVAPLHHHAVFLPQQVLEQDLDGIGNPPHIEARSGQRGRVGAFCIRGRPRAKWIEFRMSFCSVHGFSHSL
jgi:hypothetical protein